MTVTESKPLCAITNTGPLISAYQSESFDLLTALFGDIHTTEGCVRELVEHGWEEAVARTGSRLVRHALTQSESDQAQELAKRIAAHPASKNREPLSHLGEAEVMVLARREEFSGAVVLLDEVAAREVATRAGLTISGFAGVLLVARGEGLLTAEQVRARLERCRQQGTHYSHAFIERIYQAAQEGEK